MEDFGPVNEIYGTYFVENLPARSTVAVKTLPKNAKVEIELIAIISKEEYEKNWIRNKENNLEDLKKKEKELVINY